MTDIESMEWGVKVIAPIKKNLLSPSQDPLSRLHGVAPLLGCRPTPSLPEGTGSGEDSLLRSMFRGYLGKGWMFEYDTALDAVTAFKRDCRSKAQLTVMAKEIRRLVTETPDDGKLRTRLTIDLNCHYVPETEGEDTREWLLSVADHLAS